MSFLQHHGFVHRQVTALRDRLAELEHDGGVALAEHHFPPAELAAIRQALDAGMARDSEPGNGAYFARDPLISLIQSAMYEHLVTTHGPGSVEHDDEAQGQAYTSGDVLGWGVHIGLSLIARFLHGGHPFNDAPARAPLADHTRLVLVSDWGTGRPEARDVIDHAATFVRSSEHPAHLIHLGDTYYSGTPFEAQHHILDRWPVSAAEREHVGSWALNGNHDMYSGGHGLFETTLGDVRFDRQRAHGKPTSWFHLQSADWNVVALDTAYRDPIIDLRGGELFLFGRLGYLNGSQAQFVNELSADPERRLLLLSHHQLFSAYDEDATKENELRSKLAPTLARGDVDAWFWGHEHDCLSYRPFRGVAAACVIGHGAVPTLARTTPPAQPGVGDPPQRVVPVIPADTPADHPLRAVEWEYRGFRIGEDGGHWAKHGCAVLDLSPDGLHARYVDDEGAVFAEQRL